MLSTATSTKSGRCLDIRRSGRPHRSRPLDLCITDIQSEAPGHTGIKLYLPLKTDAGTEGARRSSLIVPVGFTGRRNPVAAKSRIDVRIRVTYIVGVVESVVGQQLKNKARAVFTPEEEILSQAHVPNISAQSFDTPTSGVAEAAQRGEIGRAHV